MRKLSYLALLSVVSNLIFPQYTWALITVEQPPVKSSKLIEKVANRDEMIATVQDSALISDDSVQSTPVKLINHKFIVITAYSSTVDQTDSTPFIAASGATVRDGIIASNTLPFHTLVKFPRLFGDKVFIVEDRLAPKNGHKIDIWFPSRGEALQFGVKISEVVVVR